ncbi:MAG: hypothetical protein WC827_00145 [Candidatus Paceibacterota bacterium]|jgi:hypothetical protein
MNIEENFLPGFEQTKKEGGIVENILSKEEQDIELKYATAEERIHCQYCEDVGICDRCERGKEELSKLK